MSSHPTPPPQHPSLGTAPSEKTLEALYVVNCRAKRCASLAETKYHNDEKTAAREYSVKKEALYKLKEQTLVKLLPAATQIDKHTISGSQYYCLIFGHISYHLPIDRVNLPSTWISERKPLNDLTKDEKKQGGDLSLETALTHLHTRFNFNANELLPQTYIWYDNRRSFAGWSCLPRPERDD